MFRFVFFKQKTAYDMRISDWSSDVCSSDLVVSQRKVKLSELDINNPGGWPRPYKIGFCVLLGALIFGLLWWVVTRDKGDQLEQLDKREAELRDRKSTRLKSSH